MSVVAVLYIVSREVIDWVGTGAEALVHSSQIVVAVVRLWFIGVK